MATALGRPSELPRVRADRIGHAGDESWSAPSHRENRWFSTPLATIEFDNEATVHVDVDIVRTVSVEIGAGPARNAGEAAGSAIGDRVDGGLCATHRDSQGRTCRPGRARSAAVGDRAASVGACCRSGGPFGSRLRRRCNCRQRSVGPPVHAVKSFGLLRGGRRQRTTSTFGIVIGPTDSAIPAAGATSRPACQASTGAKPSASVNRIILLARALENADSLIGSRRRCNRRSILNERPGRVSNPRPIQPFINFNLPRAWAISTGPVITSNWSAPQVASVGRFRLAWGSRK